MKRSVLIVAEGEHELAGGTADAALPILVKRLLGDGVDLRPTSKRIRDAFGPCSSGTRKPACPEIHWNHATGRTAGFRCGCSLD